jgi:hypothetical protein
MGLCLRLGLRLLAHLAMRFKVLVDVRQIRLEAKRAPLMRWRGDTAFETQVGCEVVITGRGMWHVLGRV